MNDVSIGLALGGGGARGLAHIHALGAFEDLGVRPSIIAGTSIGGIFAALYAAGYSSTKILAHADRLVNNRFKLFADFLRAEPSIKRAGASIDNFRLGEIDLQRALSVVFPPDFPKTFEELDIPTRIVATNYYSQHDEVFSSGALLPAMSASAAVPALFRPVIINGTVYIDGSTTNPVPIDVVSGKADIIVGINVIGQSRGEENKRPRKVDVLTSSNYIMQQAIVDNMETYYKPDYIARADVEGVRIVDFTRIHSILEDSRALRVEIRNRLESLLEEKAQR